MADIDLQGESISSLDAAMSAGRLTSRALTQHCLERIEAIEPRINAILELNPTALDEAEQLDQARRSGQPCGPLHGLPILIKDNIDTAGPMQTTAGSLALAGHHAARDAFIVNRLREAGALLLGKTNLSEWANFRSTRSSSGWSSRGGQTRNPYALDRTPGGSSSGSAAAVAAGLCVAAIGTETDGSIVYPAAMNSIVGIKPGIGRVSRDGIIPIAHSQDTAGPMARCVQDAAILLGVIAGSDPQDPATRNADAGLQALYGYRPDSGDLRGARIGIARNYCGFHPAVDALFNASLKTLASAGAILIEDLELTPAARIRADEEIVMSTEFKAGLNHYLCRDAAAGTGIRSLAEVIDFNECHQDRVMPFFAQEILLRAERTGGLEDPLYIEALERCRRRSRDQGIDRLIDSHQLDAIAAPTTGVPWLIDWINGDHRLGGSAGPAAVAGYPAISVPAGYVFGLPIGLSLFGALGTELRLIRIAGGFEQASEARIAPTLAAHAGI